jgi:RNA polymerase sigma-70 factor (ECF subfamily)
VSDDDVSLVVRAKDGDVHAFESLVERHGVFVFNLALRVSGDTQEAEDVAQETFVRAWRGLANYRGQARFTTWLYRILTNLFYNRLPGLRKELATLPVDDFLDFEPDDRQGPEAGFLADETRSRLHAAIEQLSPAQRLFITLRYLQEMSYEEIAQAAQVPLGTVKTGIHRARRQLRQTLEQYEVEYGSA